MIRSRAWMTFSLGALAFVIAIVTGFFSGFRIGYDSAVSRLDANTVYVERYPVEYLVRWTSSDEPDAAPLLEVAKSTIYPTKWGRPNAIYFDDENMTLTVTHDKHGHAAVQQLLAGLKKHRSTYDAFVAKDLCGYCGKSSLPQVGERCNYCQDRNVPPSITAPRRQTLYR